MAWRAARSLTALHRQLKAYAPRAAPPATPVTAWGTIGDTSHTSTSDHSPKDFPGWGDDIVTAADFPHAPKLGLDAGAVLDSIRLSRDPRARYGIFGGRIFSNHPVTQNGKRYAAWDWRPYSGRDGHFAHGHLSVVGDSRADGEQAWQVTPPAPSAPPPIQKGERMQFVAKDNTGQYYVCDGIESRAVPASAVNDVLYLARTLGWGHGPVGAEWADGGYCRLGWTEGAFGRVAKPVEVTFDVTTTGALAQALAALIGKAPRRFEAVD